MKRKTAKEILTESFLELAEKNNVDKITVKDIVANCGYSTATFYRHFKDKYDLIGWEYSIKIEQFIARMDGKEYCYRDFVTDGVALLNKRKSYLVNLFLHTTGLDSFKKNMLEINFRFLKQLILNSSKTATFDESLEMYLSFYCEGCVALFCDWILGKYLADSKKLTEVFLVSLPSPLKNFLV